MQFKKHKLAQVFWEKILKHQKVPLLSSGCEIGFWYLPYSNWSWTEQAEMWSRTKICKTLLITLKNFDKQIYYIFQDWKYQKDNSKHSPNLLSFFNLCFLQKMRPSEYTDSPVCIQCTWAESCNPVCFFVSQYQTFCEPARDVAF